jgi:hypothetical protein
LTLLAAMCGRMRDRSRREQNAEVGDWEAIPNPTPTKQQMPRVSVTVSHRKEYQMTSEQTPAGASGSGRVTKSEDPTRPSTPYPSATSQTTPPAASGSSASSERNGAESLKTEAQRAGNVVAEVTTSLADDLKTAAQEKFHEAAAEAGHQAEKAKDSVADEVSNVATSLRHAAQELRGGSPQERTLGMIADGLADASETMRNRDLGDLLDDVRGLARRNPMIFIGGAVLLGFAAARYGKASQPSPAGHTGSGAAG